MVNVKSLILILRLDSTATPCSVNAIGGKRSSIRSELEVPNWRLQSASSSWVKTNMKSPGNRMHYVPSRVSALFVSTPYIAPPNRGPASLSGREAAGLTKPQRIDRTDRHARTAFEAICVADKFDRVPFEGEGCDIDRADLAAGAAFSAFIGIDPQRMLPASHPVGHGPDRADTTPCALVKKQCQKYTENGGQC